MAIFQLEWLLSMLSLLFLCVCVCMSVLVSFHMCLCVSISFLFVSSFHTSSFSSFFLLPHLLYKLKQPVQLFIYLLLRTAQFVYKSLSKKTAIPLTLMGPKGFHFMCLTDKVTSLVFSKDSIISMDILDLRSMIAH